MLTNTRKITSIFLASVMMIVSTMMAGHAAQDAGKIAPSPMILPKTVFGDEDSRYVKSSDAWGYTSVVKLYITFPKSSKLHEGSAFFYGPNVLATAAHCLYDARFGGKATSIKIVLRGKSWTVGSNSLFYPSGWNGVSKESWQYDYGVIKLPSNVSEPYFGLWRNGAAKDKTYFVTGYREYQDTARICSGKLISVNQVDITFKHDVIPGQSGCPVYDSEGFVVGIYNYNAESDAYKLEDASPESNSGARMNDKLYSFLLSHR